MGGMQPGPRPRTRRKKAPITYVDAAARVTPEETPAISSAAYTAPDSNNSETFFENMPQPSISDSSGVMIEDAPQPTVIESTGMAIEDFTPALEPAGERTNFFFPPLPPREGTLEHRATTRDHQPRARRQRQNQHTGQTGKAVLAALLAMLRALGRGLRQFGRGSAKEYRRYLRPGVHKV